MSKIIGRALLVALIGTLAMAWIMVPGVSLVLWTDYPVLGGVWMMFWTLFEAFCLAEIVHRQCQ